MRWFGHVRVSISRSKPKPQASFFIISAQESVIERKEYRLKWEIEFGPTCILAKFSVWLVQLLMREFNACFVRYTTSSKASPLSGYGVGLPLSRLHARSFNLLGQHLVARYMGGTLELISLPGYGGVLRQVLPSQNKLVA